MSATENFGKAIIAATTVQRQLVDIGCELEHGARVIIQPAHNQGIDLEWYIIDIQKTLDSIEVFATGTAQVIADLGRGCDFWLILRLFTIQHTQGVLIESHFAILTALG